MDPLGNVVKRIIVTVATCIITAIYLLVIDLNHVKVSEKTILVVTYLHGLLVGLLYRLSRDTPNCVRSMTFLMLGAMYYWKFVKKVLAIGFNVYNFETFSFSVFMIFFTVSAIESICMDYMNQANQAQQREDDFDEFYPIVHFH